MFIVPVLVTAPEGYSLRFVEALKACNADRFCFEPISIPLIRTTPCEDISQIISQAQDYDYMVFTSRKAILVLSEYLKKAKISADSIRLPKACAIGKDNEALSLLGISPAFISAEPSLKGIADEFRSRVQEFILHSVRPRIAVLGPRVEDLIEPDTVPDFLKALHAIQAEVTYITAYVTRPATEQALREAETLLRDKIQWVAFTSATKAQVYKRLSHNTTPSIACFGPYTAHCVRKEGLNVRFTSPDYSSFSAFAKHLKEFILSASEKA